MKRIRLTNSMVARQLRRIARLLRYADYLQYNFYSAGTYLDKAVEALSQSKAYFNDVLKIFDQDASQLYREFLNFFTQKDTDSKAFFEDAKEQFDRLYTPVMNALKKAQQAKTLEGLQRAIYAETDNINVLLNLFIEFKREVIQISARHSRDELGRRIMHGGALGWQRDFIYDIYKALGLNPPNV